MKTKAIKTSLLIVVVLTFNSCAVFLQKAGIKNYTLSEDISSGEYNDYQSDFMYLTQLLDIGFPDIDSVFPREDRIDQRNAIMESLSEADIENKDFVLQTRKYLSNFHNQHTTLYLKSNFEKVYPFVIHIYNNQWFLLNVDNSQDRQHIGQRITKINNMEVSDIENRLLQFTFGENRINQQYELSNRQFYNKPAYLKDVHIINKLSDKLKIEFADHSMLYLEAVSTSDIRLHDIQIPPNEITGFQKETYRYTIHAEEDFAYLQFHNCHDKIDILEGIESYVKPWLQPLARAYVKGQFKKEKPSKKISSFYNPEYPIFKDFVWELMDSINNANIQNLIIDLRGNPGGNLTLGIQLLYFLTDQKDLKGFKEYAFTSEVYKHYFASDYAALENRYPEGVLSNTLVLKKDSDDLFEGINNSKSKYYIPENRSVFKGEVYLLSDYSTGSAAAMLTTLFQDNNIATVIGTSVGNNPTGATTYTPMKLPKTQASISIATTYQQRPAQDKGVIQIPDYWIEYSVEDVLSGNDPHLEKAIELINLSAQPVKK